LVWEHLLFYKGYAQAAKTIDLPHPLGITSGQIIFDCNDMTPPSTPAGNGDRHGTCQSLTLSGGHLSYTSILKSQSAGHLNRKRSLANLAKCDLPNQCKGSFEVRSTISMTSKDLMKHAGRFAEL
jgi:hypothetical protein